MKTPEQEIAKLELYIKEQEQIKADFLKSLPVSKQYILKMYLQHKLKQGYSPIIVIVGHTRGGKTCTGLKVSEDLDGDFDFNQQYFYEIKTFVNNLDRLIGRTVIIDEAGYNLSSLNYWSYVNKTMNYLLQTQGVRNICYFFVLPHLEYLAKHIRRMIDVIIEIVDKGIAKIYFVQTFYSKIDGKKTFLYNIETLVNIPLPKCFEEFKEYEKTFKRDILTELQQEMNLSELKEAHKKARIREDLEIFGFDLNSLQGNEEF